MNKTLNDYVKKVNERYPQYSEKDIQAILKWGFRALESCIKFGCDFYTHSKNFWFFIGRISYPDPIVNHKYTTIKKLRKIKYQWIEDRCPNDGYYYFIVTDKQLNKYMKKNTLGRLLKFGDISLYRTKEAALWKCIPNSHLFRVKYSSDFGFYKYIENYETRNAEYILKWTPNRSKFLNNT